MWRSFSYVFLPGCIFSSGTTILEVQRKAYHFELKPLAELTFHERFINVEGYELARNCLT